MTKTCYCHTCYKEFHALGIARHRAMHRDKREDCKITYTNYDTYLHKFSELKANVVRRRSAKP